MAKNKAVMEGITRMNDEMLEFYREKLRALLSGLEDEDARGADAQKVVELDQQVVGRLSRMDALQNQAMAQAQAGRRQAQRQRIFAALARIDEGEFGYCTDCGEDLPAARLEADPTVPRCLSCMRG